MDDLLAALISLLSKDPSPVFLIGPDAEVIFENPAASDLEFDFEDWLKSEAAHKSLSLARSVSEPIPVAVHIGDQNLSTLMHRISLFNGQVGVLIRFRQDASDLRFRALTESTEKLQREMEKRRGIQARLSLVFNNAGVGVLLVTRQGIVEEANPAFIALVDAKSEEIVGCHIQKLFDFNSAVPDFIRPDGNLRVFGRKSKSFEAAINSADGVVPVEVVYCPPTGDVGLYVLTVRDLTLGKRYADAIERSKRLQEASDRASAGEKEKIRFLATMSHELRTPMNGICAAIEMLAADKTLSGPQQRLVKLAAKSSDVALRQINSVLHFLKAEGAAPAVAVREFTVEALLDDVVEQFEVLAKKKGIALISTVKGPSNLTLTGNYEFLFTILQNLISNAIKFTDYGAVSVTADLMPVPESNIYNLCLRVSDTGCGISEERLQKIFQPFESSATIREVHSGVGLGLSIVESLVEKLDGFMTVQSTEGLETTFEVAFKIPAAQSAPKPRAEAPKELKRNSQLAGLDLKGKSVVFADDNPINCDIMREILTSFGADVIEARDGESAMYLLRDFTPDHVLLDIHMPNMNGYQAAQRMRKLPHLKDVNIVGVTAYVDDEIIETCRKCGMNAVVQKPVKLAELADALNARTPNAPVKIPNFEKYVDLCLRDISDAIVAAKSALKKKDFGTIVDVIHPVQGAASMLSMGSLAGALRDLEALARVQSDHIGLAIEDVQLELEKLKQEKPTEGMIKS